MQEIFTVYKITDKTNNKVYIGVTSQDIENRLKGHISKAEGGSTLKLHKMIMEHGKENFVVSRLEITTDNKVAPELEKKYVKLFQSNNPDYGYNTSEGGEYIMITEAMRIAMSEGQKGCSKPRLRKGVIQFASTGEFLKEYSGMTEASKETGVSRAAILRMLKGEIKRGSKSNPYLWKWSSDYEEIPSKIDPKEVYLDISYKSSISDKCAKERDKYLTKTGNLYELQKPVLKYSTDGKFIEEYPSVAEAARSNNMSPEALRRHFRGCYDYNNEKVLKRLKYIWKLKN